jgi:hypothetical protein
MSKNLSKKEIQDRICQLIYRAETFLNWSNLLLNVYEKEWDSLQNSVTKQMKFYNKPIAKCIILHNVLYFQEAAICLHTLLESKKQPTEISFGYYFANAENSELKKKINDIRNEYRATRLDKFRNQLIAHKQADSAGDPLTGFLNPVKKEHVEKACSIVNKLKSLTDINFNCAANNYFEDFYSSGFEVLYKLCESTFKKRRKTKPSS